MQTSDEILALADTAILTPHVSHAREINDILLEKIHSPAHTFEAINEMSYVGEDSFLMDLEDMQAYAENNFPLPSLSRKVTTLYLHCLLYTLTIHKFRFNLFNR